MAGTPISSQGGRDCLTKLLPIRSVDFLMGQSPFNKVLPWALFMKENLKFLTLSSKGGFQLKATKIPLRLNTLAQNFENNKMHLRLL